MTSAKSNAKAAPAKFSDSLKKSFSRTFSGAEPDAGERSFFQNVMRSPSMGARKPDELKTTALEKMMSVSSRSSKVKSPQMQTPPKEKEEPRVPPLNLSKMSTSPAKATEKDVDEVSGLTTVEAKPAVVAVEEKPAVEEHANDGLPAKRGKGALRIIPSLLFAGACVVGGVLLRQRIGGTSEPAPVQTSGCGALKVTNKSRPPVATWSGSCRPTLSSTAA